MNVILRKTEAGQQALQARDGGPRLPVRLRTLLLQVDGLKTSDELVHLALSLGNQPEALDKLLEMGLVEIVRDGEVAPTASFAAAAVAGEPVVDALEVNEALPEENSDDEPDLPVSAKLPEHLRPVAAEMREIADKQLGLKAMLLKRRISRCDTEQELRQALATLNEALTNATNPGKAGELLANVSAQLPTIGLFRPQQYKR